MTGSYLMTDLTIFIAVKLKNLTEIYCNAIVAMVNYLGELSRNCDQ